MRAGDPDDDGLAELLFMGEHERTLWAIPLDGDECPQCAPRTSRIGTSATHKIGRRKKSGACSSATAPRDSGQGGGRVQAPDTPEEPGRR